MLNHLLRAFLAGAIAALTALSGVHAQQGVRHTKSLPVDAQHMVILIKTSVIAVNHANRTGDYSVLYALAAPGFRERNSEAELEKSFARLRESDLDLGPVILYKPKFTSRPGITPDGFLRLRGYFATRPVQVNFDLMFQAVGGEWRLNGIGLHPSKSSAAAATGGRAG